MTTIKPASFACAIALLGALGSLGRLHAQLPVGTWVRQPTASMPTMTMKVEACCGSGRRLTYNLGSSSTAMVLKIESRFDGSSAPVLMNGEPSGQTMEIKRVDDHHLSNVMKMNGKTFATSKATLSADGKTLTVITDVTSAFAGQPLGKSTEVWVRQ